jgi:hypothetical protein
MGVVPFFLILAVVHWSTLKLGGITRVQTWR